MMRATALRLQPLLRRPLQAATTTIAEEHALELQLQRILL